MDRESLESLDEDDLLELIRRNPGVKTYLENYGIKYKYLFGDSSEVCFCLDHREEYSHFCLKCNLFVCNECDCNEFGDHEVITIDKYLELNEYLIPSFDDIKIHEDELKIIKEKCLDKIKYLPSKKEKYENTRDNLEQIIENSKNIKDINKETLREIRDYISGYIQRYDKDDDSYKNKTLGEYLGKVYTIFKYDDENDGYDENFTEDFNLYNEQYETYDSKVFSYECELSLARIKIKEIDVILTETENKSLTKIQKAIGTYLRLKGDKTSLECDVNNFCAFDSANLLKPFSDVIGYEKGNFTKLAGSIFVSPSVSIKDLPIPHEDVIISVSNTGILGYVSKYNENYEMVLINLFNNNNKAIIKDVGGMTTLMFYDDKIGLLTCGRRVRIGNLDTLLGSGDVSVLFTCPKSKLVCWGASEVSYVQNTRKAYYLLNDTSLCEFDVDTEEGISLTKNCSSVVSLMGISIPNIKLLYCDINCSCRYISYDNDNKIVIDSPNAIKYLITSEEMPPDFSSAMGFYMGNMFIVHGEARQQLKGAVWPKKYIGMVRIYKNIFLVSDVRRDWRVVRISVL